ncbi:unnamed protein product [Rhizophagus irregularis]|nr:unnamed protein product [Rhizophagus irregularis]
MSGNFLCVRKTFGNGHVLEHFPDARFWTNSGQILDKFWSVKKMSGIWSYCCTETRSLLKKKSSSFLKNKDLAKEYDVSEGMICDILKTKDRWLAVNLYSYQASLRRERKLPFIVIEEALALWVENALQAGLIISDDILSIKTLEFAFLCNEEKFKGSDG